MASYQVRFSKKERTMRFHNPWIDPRITQARPEDAKTYLLRHGWKSLGPAANPLLEMFEGPGAAEDRVAVLVPLQVDQGPMLQRMIDLVSDLARVEDRWAVTVLNDILQSAAAESVNTNGPSVPQKVDPATR
jgi:hypothetical protein